MKLSIDTKPLDIVRNKMGAPLSIWTPDSTYFTIEVKLDKDILDKIRPTYLGGPLAYDGRQILLYIKDTRKPRETLLHSPEDSPRFHISECSTLDSMRRDGRFERYVMVNFSDDLFNVDATDPHTSESESLKRVKLYVCRNCLKALNLQEELSVWPQFSISKFFRDNETFFSRFPEHTDVTAPSGGYPGNWPKISKTYRELQRWKCEQCGVDLSSREHRRLLHCHHRNGDVRNTRSENLQALCAECHSGQPRHERRLLGEADRAVLADLRARQGKV